MPTYQCLDTEVQLCTWTPLLRYSTASKAANTEMAPSIVTKARVPVASPRVKKDSLVNEALGNAGDSIGPLKVTKLNEEYFRGHNGLDFLGMDMPFYLIHAGGDLYREITSLTGRAALQDQSPPERAAHQKAPLTSIGSGLSQVRSYIFRSMQNTLNPSPMPREGFSPHVDDLNAPSYAPSGSDLLTMPSLESSPPYSNLRIKQSTSRPVSKSRSARYTHPPTKAEQ